METKCQNCGKPLDDALLTHCSNECQFQNYLKKGNEPSGT